MRKQSWTQIKTINLPHQESKTGVSVAAQKRTYVLQKSFFLNSWTQMKTLKLL